MIESDAELDRIMAVMDAAFDPAFGEAWTRRQVADALLLGNCHHALIDATGRPPRDDEPAAGFRVSRMGVEEEELLLLGVIPAARRCGLGRTMLEDLRREARLRGAHRLLLEMRRDNPAEALYRQFGFEIIGTRKNYYRMRDGARVDAITFSYRID